MLNYRCICSLGLVITAYLQCGFAGRIDSCHRSARSASRVSEQKCEEYTRDEECQNTYEDISPNFVGTSQPGDFPHLAFIAANSSKNAEERFVCSGSLISPRFVLTVAHCVTINEKKNLYVSLGDYNIDPAIDDGTTPVQVPVKTIYAHPEYKSPHKYYDIALLELEHDVIFSSSIRPACLGTEDQTHPYKAVISTIDGTRDSQLRQKEILAVAVTEKTNDYCNEKFSRNRLWKEGMAESQLCGQEGVGTNIWCKGFSGSPMQIITSNDNGCAYHLMGITAFGFRKCDDRPTVFTRVSSYIDWIENVVWPEK